jgi:hypothetical protein
VRDWLFLLSPWLALVWLIIWDTREPAQEIDPNRIVALGTLLLALGTFALAWVANNTDEATHSLASAALKQAEAADRQARVMQGQLDAMEADQRPWIKVETETYDDFRPTKIVVPPIKFILTNVGKSPAFNVQVFPRAFAMATGHDDLFKEQKEWCGRYRKQRNAGGNVLDDNQGIIIFPNEKAPWEKQGGILGAGVIQSDIAKYSYADEQGRKTLSLWIYGCVLYDFGRPGTTHQTAYVYRIAHLVHRAELETAMTFATYLDEVIPKADIMLFPIGVNGQTD